MQLYKTFVSNNVHEKITRFWQVENKCLLMQHECKVVTRAQLQIAHAQLKHFVCLDFLWCFFTNIINK